METIVKYTGGKAFSYTYNMSEECVFDIHLHDHYEIFQAISPNIRYFVEGTSYDLNPGDLIITNNKEIHRPTTIDNKGYERRFIQFSPSIISPYHDIDYNPLQFFINRKSGTFNHFIIPEPALSVVQQFLNTIEACFYLNTPKSLYEGRLILNQLLIELNTLHQSMNSKTEVSSNLDPRISKAIAYLDLNYRQPFHLDTFSKIHHIDKYYLSHLFKENTGFTLIEYIQSKRIQYAKTLLVEDLSLNEISLLCGFNDYSNFFKTFKKLVKHSPKEYKKQQA